MKKNKTGANMGAILGENTHGKSNYKRAVFSLEFLPVRADENFSDRPDLVNITREITFSYGLRRHTGKEKGSWWGNVAPHFILTVKDDCLLEVTKSPQYRNFTSWEDFVRKSEQNLFVRLLRECSNLNQDMFAVAELNPFSVFHISIDMSKYLSKVGSITAFITNDIRDGEFASRNKDKALAYLTNKYGGSAK